MTFCVDRVDAQTVAPGPYYATPSWDQTLPCGSAANCPRFVVLSNFSDLSCDPISHVCVTVTAAVLDRETGLVWERVPDGTRRSRQEAAATCHDKAIGGRKGWRLPTISELASLVDPGQDSPSLPVGHPFIGVAFSQVRIFQTYYWSSTSFPEEPVIPFLPPFPSALDTETLDFRDGRITFAHSTQNSLRSWCVRGGER